MEGLVTQPSPSISKTLDIQGLAVAEQIENRSLRFENWRVIYAINDVEKWVWVLAIRQRPPYDYEDVTDRTSKLSV
jgi:hypothetical protein